MITNSVTLLKDNSVHLNVNGSSHRIMLADELFDGQPQELLEVFVLQLNQILQRNRLITISEASQILGISPSTIRNLEAEGKLTSEKTPRRHRRYRYYELLDQYTQILKEAHESRPSTANA